MRQPGLRTGGSPGLPVPDSSRNTGGTSERRLSVLKSGSPCADPLLVGEDGYCLEALKRLLILWNRFDPKILGEYTHELVHTERAFIAQDDDARLGVWLKEGCGRIAGDAPECPIKT